MVPAEFSFCTKGHLPIQTPQWQASKRCDLGKGDFSNDLQLNIKMTAPPQCFKSSKEVSHKTVLNVMSVLKGTQLDLGTKAWGMIRHN